MESSDAGKSSLKTELKMLMLDVLPILPVNS